MAKTSVMSRNDQRKKLSTLAVRTARNALKDAIKNDPENRDTLVMKLQKRPRNESPIRIRNRCQLCGRGRGTLRKFGLCRICLRQATMRGDVPGLRKASW
jgi:small subunit ribosomal protein S14